MTKRLKDIADEVGVSIRTASQILNRGNSHLFKEETRQRVETVARKLGYRPNAAARAMTSGSMQAVGLLSSQDAGAGGVPDGVLWGLEQVLGEKDYLLVMARYSHERLSRQGEIPRVLREWMVDGLIVAYSVNPPQALVRQLEQWQARAVWYNVKIRSDAVRPDDHGAAHHATSRLVELGHHTIAYVSPQPKRSAHYSMRDRERGYADAMREAGLQTRVVRPATCERPQANAGRLLADCMPASAIITYSPDDALRLREAALALGWRTPEDLSLVTFPWEGRMGALRDALGLYTLPHMEIGRRIAVMLLDKLSDSGWRYRTEVVPFRFGSTGIAPPGLADRRRPSVIQPA